MLATCTNLNTADGTISTKTVLNNLTHVVSDDITAANVYAVQVAANSLSDVTHMQFANAYSSDGNFTNNEGVKLMLHDPHYWVGVEPYTLTVNTDLRYMWCSQHQTKMELIGSGNLTKR